MRTGEEVAARCIVLCCVLAHQQDSALTFDGWLAREDLWRFASPKEQDFLLNPDPPEKEERQSSWRIEAFAMLMWCLGKIDSLPPPVQMESSWHLLEKMPGPGDATRAFVEDAQLRSAAEIVATHERIQRDYQPLERARRLGHPDPEGVEWGVLYERLYALNWLSRDNEDEWDDVSVPVYLN